MILSYAKPFNEKTREQLAKIWRKKKHVSDLSTLSIDDMKIKKKQICFVALKILNIRQNTIFTQQTYRPAILLKRDPNTSIFL